MLSGRGLCDGLITRPQGSYRLWCVVVCDLETGCWAKEKMDTKNSIYGLSKADFFMNRLPLHKAFILGASSYLLYVPIKIILPVRLF